MSRSTLAAAIGTLVLTSAVHADVFGEGENQFALDFVTISGDAGDLGSWSAGSNYTFTGVDRGDYRIGMFEITNSQWSKFFDELGVPVTGSPPSAYDEPSFFAGADVATNNVSWYEAAQFVNWLNTSTGRQAAYKFTGTQGTSDYALAAWSLSEAAGGTNIYRHKDAVYYLPTEDEWMKAAYWNGDVLQDFATRPGDEVHQGDGVSGTGWNYYDNGYATDPLGPWDVGSGSEELNGTFDMMGNVYEWMESPYWGGVYEIAGKRALRGGPYNYGIGAIGSSDRYRYHPDYDGDISIGFRVAAEVPEPTTLSLILAAGLTVGGRSKLRHQRRN